jgi:hypothetical protein
MMLRNLVDEIVRRRLWPIPLVALAVVVAAPLLFLKSGPPPAALDATAATASAQVDLPVRAQRLLTTTDAGRSSGRRLSRSARDPFQAPASRSKAAKKVSKKAASSSKKTATTTTATKGTSDNPVAVVVQNADGSTTSGTQASTSGGDGTSTSRSTSTPSASPIAPSVDVRFGAHKDSPIQRRIARLKTFEVDGEITVVFVKYSPTHHKAIFAINPTTTVGGDVDCRLMDGLCSYVDIPAGSYARLTFTLSDGSRVSRRLDVVRSHDA